ncbi:MAG TPA: site-specific DNA-methyltransferase [Terriglobia bacterium]|nr:site-specific DNA-methyltransferase [Terriglobia bacterium]
MQVCADSRKILELLPDESVDLIITSPPFALLRQKSYGNEGQTEYAAWLAEFGDRAHRVLKQTGSFVLDLGGAYERGKPVRSLYNFRVLLDFCDRLKYNLAEEFFWYNPAKLPSPIEWVNKRKIRVKDAVNTIWWFSKGSQPKADVTRVLTPYSERMKTLLKNPGRFYRPKERPSGHDIAAAFSKENLGAIPSNLLQIANTDSNSHYLRTCKLLGKDGHPARFPPALPMFFIEFLTEPGDCVVDIFSGSNTTGAVAEQLARNWLGVEVDRDYAVLSAIRFMENHTEREIIQAMKLLESRQYLSLNRSRPVEEDRTNNVHVMEESQRQLFTQPHAETKGNFGR